MKSPTVSAVRQSSDSIERDHARKTALQAKSEKDLSSLITHRGRV